MRISISPEKLALLKQVDALCDEGLTYEEIADRLKTNSSTLRYQLGTPEGFAIQRAAKLRHAATGMSLQEMQDAGVLVVTAAEPVTV